jgi:hypothetical protein
MPKITTEELHINKINLGIRAIQKGTKTAKTANLSGSFEKLKSLNKGMHDELMNNYRATLYGIPVG